MTKKQHYMTRDERLKLEALHRAGLSVARIARELGFCRQTIYNEIRRGIYIHDCGWRDEERYSADKAQEIHDYAQTGKGRPLKIGHDRKYAEYLERMVRKQRYSPAAALAAARRDGFLTSICAATFYSYIEKGIFLHLTNSDLWEKSRRKKRGYHPVRRIAHPALPSITNRPEHISQRKEYGHWEMDLVVGCSGSRAVLLTLTERRTREELIFKLPDKKAATIRGVFDELERSTPGFRQKFRSITTDNGSEFLEYEKLRQSIQGGIRFEVYYCHSYAAWEKGSNENHNRMIRRWFPKGTDFTKISKKRIAEIQHWMNHYPRKILNWKCPKEAA
ncbi:MAG: IS30 family transposase [Lawsonibacter sp.]|nr:IS30 family transposase [Lawsonibacter sp.]